MFFGWLNGDLMEKSWLIIVDMLGRYCFQMFGGFYVPIPSAKILDTHKAWFFRGALHLFGTMGRGCLMLGWQACSKRHFFLLFPSLGISLGVGSNLGGDGIHGIPRWSSVKFGVFMLMLQSVEFACKQIVWCRFLLPDALTLRNFLTGFCGVNWRKMGFSQDRKFDISTINPI